KLPSVFEPFITSSLTQSPKERDARKSKTRPHPTANGIPDHPPREKISRFSRSQCGALRGFMPSDGVEPRAPRPLAREEMTTHRPTPGPYPPDALLRPATRSQASDCRNAIAGSLSPDDGEPRPIPRAVHAGPS